MDTDADAAMFAQRAILYEPMIGWRDSAARPYISAAELDIAYLSQGNTATILCDLPLWLQAEPQASKDWWNAFANSLPKHENWDVWLKWWKGRRDGATSDENSDVFRVVGDTNFSLDTSFGFFRAKVQSFLDPAHLHEPFWEQPISSINASIAGQITTDGDPQFYADRPSVPSFDELSQKRDTLYSELRKRSEKSRVAPSVTAPDHSTHSGTHDNRTDDFKVSESKMDTCPFCKNDVHAEATICGHCRAQKGYVKLEGKVYGLGETILKCLIAPIFAYIVLSFILSFGHSTITDIFGIIVMIICGFPILYASFGFIVGARWFKV